MSVDRYCCFGFRVWDLESRLVIFSGSGEYRF